MLRRLFGPTLTVLAVAAAATTLGGYQYTDSGSKWPDGAIGVEEQLTQTGGGSGALIDGSASWEQVFEGAIGSWNANLNRVQMVPVRNSSAPIESGNFPCGGSPCPNNMIFDNDVFGQSFPTGVLAITRSIYLVSTGQKVEADIVFNTAFVWNSFRGALRPGIQDFFRVAVHELGHLLGLDHPDDWGQNITAVMNARVSSTDGLTPDDIAGAQALYPINLNQGPTGSVIFPPRNESLDFRNRLESQYRDVLRRTPQGTFVDNEGDVIWTSEYLRFRANLCNNASAILNVFTIIQGRGNPGVCGTAPQGVVNFPPRDQALSFRQRLETYYRDTLRRTAILSAVDNEGDIVWTSEYLRFRVNACTHGDSVNKVIAEITSGGSQPVCR